MNPAVDFYFEKSGKWQNEVKQLRSIALNCGLSEELKWGVPCYAFESANIVLIHTFKDYCALLFFKGVLLNDADNLLVQQTKNVQAARQLRFVNVNEISETKTRIKSFIYEAIAVEKSGLKVPMKKSSAFAVAEEFQTQLKKNPKLKAAFDSLTPGRQRAYLLYFSQPKQSKTRSSRVEKYVPQILMGKGLDDK